MRILITGAGGYIGKTLYNALRDTHYVTAITRREVDLTKATEVKAFFDRNHFFDVIIHCAVAGAAKPREEDWNILDDNLKMYYNLLQNRKRFKRLIHFGSGAETYLGSTPYGYSKKVIAKSILNQEDFYNIKIFGLFSEDELDTRFFKANIKRYLDKKPMQIHQDKAMDFFYMEDFIAVVDYYINEEEPPKEYDCVYKAPCLLGKLAGLINKLDEHEVSVFFEAPGFDHAYTSLYRDTKLPIEFVGLEQGIKNMYFKLKEEQV